MTPKPARERLLLGLTLLTAAGAWLYGFWAEPFSESAMHWRRQLKSQTDKLVKARALTAREAEFRAAYTRATSGGAFADPLESVDRLAKETAVVLESLRPSPTGEGEGAENRTRLEFSIQAPPENVGKFLYRLETKYALFHVDQMNCEGSETSGGLRCSLTLSLPNLTDFN